MNPIIGTPTQLTLLTESLTADERNEVDVRFRELVKAVFDTGGKGDLTLKVALAKNGENSVQIDVDVRTKIPRKKPGKQVRFIAFDDDLKATGELSQYPHTQEPLLERGSLSAVPGGKKN